MSKERQYRAALYLRLSREDADGEESGSIKGQRELLLRFLEQQQDILICEEIVDDGYSGAVFERPGFLRLLEHIRQGEIDCVAVKDLSRFGRNYIETGRYLEQIFPLLGVRFIAVNDGYDSAGRVGQPDPILLPFQNLMNDAYCRDISRKVKSQLAIKRLRGAYTGAFAPFGYRRSSHDRERLEPDPRAAAVVRRIFRHTLEGVSRAGVARMLDAEGVLSPARYRRAAGQNFFTPFERANSGWSAGTVARILSDPVYLGTLRQGKTVRPDFRSKLRRAVPEQNWAISRDCHPPLVSRAEFQAVARLLSRDTRACPGKIEKYPLSGLLVCGLCGQTMVRKTVPAGAKKYVYYVCARHSAGAGCPGIRIAEKQMQSTCESLMQSFFKVTGRPHRGKQTDQREQVRLKRELEREKRRLESLEPDLASGLLNREDAEILFQTYTERCELLRRALTQAETNNTQQSCGGGLSQRETARLLSALVEKIVVRADGTAAIYLAVAARCRGQEVEDGAQEQKIHIRSGVRRLRVCRGLGRAG